MAFESGTAYPESDADDEYERSVHASSPVQVTDDDSVDSGSEDDESGSGSEHTPTTYGRMSGGERGGGVVDWTAEECADFIGGLGLGVYSEIFLGEFSFLRREGGVVVRGMRADSVLQRTTLQDRVWWRFCMKI
jgi:hypothetical protein